MILRRWPLIVVLALAPLWLVGILDRGAWTPDEPREADVAWRMSLQGDRTLPHLGDTPFLEKPPLSYWMSAAAIQVFGDSAAAARIPNLLYASVTALAIGALAFAMAGPTAAVVAALVAGTAITAFRVSVWLAPDACLLAGCAVALWGAYVGLVARPGRAKFAGYTLMHAGAAVGFMAKSAPGWLVPALALVTVLVWERRWSEFRRWELYAGLLVQGLLIGPWLYAVLLTDHGAEALRTLFWNNIVGRFTQVAGAGALDYTTGHRNSPGKYLIELPVYLLPWTVLAAAAARRAWNRARGTGIQGTRWRFAIAAIVPFLALLCMAATARDIYAAPILLGFALLIGLWAGELDAGRSGRVPTGFDLFAIRGTRLLVGALTASFAAMLGIVAAATADLIDVLVAAIVLTVSVFALWFAPNLRRRGDLLRQLGWTYVAYVFLVTLTGLAVFPTIDQWQDLPALAQRIEADSRRATLALLNPDETTIAMLDHRFNMTFTVLAPAAVDAARVAGEWLTAHGGARLVLVKLPGRASGPVSQYLRGWIPLPQPDDGVAAVLESSHLATIVHRYELPEGRRYALLASPQAQPSSASAASAPLSRIL